MAWNLLLDDRPSDSILSVGGWCVCFGWVTCVTVCVCGAAGEVGQGRARDVDSDVSSLSTDWETWGGGVLTEDDGGWKGMENQGVKISDCWCP